MNPKITLAKPEGTHRRGINGREQNYYLEDSIKRERKSYDQVIEDLKAESRNLRAEYFKVSEEKLALQLARKQLREELERIADVVGSISAWDGVAANNRDVSEIEPRKIIEVLK